MKMFWSPRSPFARKVMIVAHERGLADAIDRVPAGVGSALLSAEVMAQSPANRIPALFGIDGAPDLTVIGSGAICRYLAEAVLGEAPGPTDWHRMSLEAVGDNIMEINVLRLGDLNRPEGMCSQKHLAAFAGKTRAALDWLDARAAGLWTDRLDAAEAAIIAALAHLDFRFAEDAWREGRPALAAWYEAIRARPSVIATEYQ